MRKICVLGMTLMLCIVLAGCGNSTSKTEDGRIILTYGYIDAYSFQELDTDIKEKIVAFNRSQEEYYIEIKKYGEDSYTDGLSEMNAEIASGKGPDIIQIDNTSHLRSYCSKRRIVDLYSLMDESSEIQKEDFLDNILAQFEEDGKLYAITPFFALSTTIGNPHRLEEERITFKQLCELMEANADNPDMEVYFDICKDEALFACVSQELERFVDWDAKTCDFRTEEFKALMEFTNRFKTEWSFSNLEGYYKIQENNLYLLRESPIYSFEEYLKYKALFGERPILAGWPTIGGSGPTITTVSPYWTINSNSKHQQAAWEFICTCFEDDYLLSDEPMTGFPMLKSSFEKSAIKAMRLEYKHYKRIDEAGNELSYTIEAATEDDIAYIKNIVSSLSPRINYGEIETIIYEEMTEYWSGVKSADEVIEVIQNRVQLYLDENK